ncbi:MAG: BPL-N domain-containing protein [Nitrospirota bacterium]
MAYEALLAHNLPFDLIRSEDIRAGKLQGYTLLFVPGGWASNKMKSLGDEGVEAIKQFIHNGGNYLGFCGGAGLATFDGIGLLPIKRKPTRERVPSFSGKIKLNLSAHPLWQGIAEPVFYAWWPSQFAIDSSINVLATYAQAMPDAFSSDLNVADVESTRSWQELEKIYGINLDPKRLINDPAVVEGSYGKGKVLLSLIHFDTPDDANGATVLKNLWSYLAGHVSIEGDFRTSVFPHFRADGASKLISEMEASIDELIVLGTRNFLWFWRTPLLLQWRRGIRGLEYCTLFILIKRISGLLKYNNTVHSSLITDHASRIEKLFMPFVGTTKKLLILERQALQNGHITYEKCDDPEIQKIRTELFANSKSYGGLFKKLIDEIDSLLYVLLAADSKHF